jgi:hypothetical protein
MQVTSAKYNDDVYHTEVRWHAVIVSCSILWQSGMTLKNFWKVKEENPRTTD